MASFYQLPAYPDDAIQIFNEVLNRPDETLVLILGLDETALDARELAHRIIDEDNVLYRYVNFLAIDDPAAIREEIDGLDTDNIDLTDLDEYILISISPFRNIISDAVTRIRFQRGKGSLTTAVLSAISNR